MKIYFKYLLGDISTKFARAFLEINTVNRTFRLPGGGRGHGVTKEKILFARRARHQRLN